MPHTQVNRAPVTTAVLLAAGRGKRLQPHTDSVPKPLLPVEGKPTLDLYCNSCVKAGIGNIILVAHHLADQIIDYGQKVPNEFDLQCTIVMQKTLDGTASALEAAVSTKDSMPIGENESFLLMATDYLIPFDFIPDLLGFHASHNADISISLKTVPIEELSSRSSVKIDDDGNIFEVVEKPAPGTAPSHYSANLAFVLPAKILDHLAHVQPSARGEREVQTAINSYLTAGGSARGLEQTAPVEWSPAQR